MTEPISVNQTVEVIEIVELNETIEVSGGSRDALSIQGRAVATDAPANDEVYAWDSTAEEWTPKGVDELAGGFVNITGDTMTGPLVVDGGVDEIQLRVQGHSTQTANIVVIEQSDGTDIVAVAVAGVTVTGTLGVSGALTASGGMDGVVGGVTPAAADFTTVDASGLVTANANVQLTDSILYGSASSAGNLELSSTSHATKGLVFMGSATNGFIFDEVENRVSIGTADTEYTIGGVTKSAVLVTETGGGMNAYDLIFHRHSNSAPVFVGGMRSRGSHSSPTAIQNGDEVFEVHAFGYDGTDWEELAGFHFEVDGAVSNNIVPGAMHIHTTDAAGAVQDALIIDSSQVLWVGSTKDTNLYRSAADTLKTDDAFVVVGALTASGGMDGVLGGVTPAAGTFTTLNATGGGALTGTWSDLGTVSAATSITSTVFVGPLTGNADTATALETARTIGNVSFDGTANIVPETQVVVDSTDATSFVAMFDSATGNLQAKTDAGLTYDATTGILTATGFAGPLTGAVTGNADTATALETARTIGGVSFDGTASIVPQTIQVVDGTDATSFVAIFDSATGNLQAKTDAGLTYAATTGILTATGFSGPLTGAVTGNADTATALETARTIGNVSFDGTANIVPETMAVVDSTDATSSIAMFDSATGNLQAKTDAGLTYDATTGTLTATALSGPLTGNASTATALETARNINGVAFDGTGDITVTAAAGTLTGATLNATVTASSLTSLGTIASLVATTADINGGTFDGIVGGTTPAAGAFTTGTFGGDVVVSDTFGMVVGHTAPTDAGDAAAEFQVVGTGGNDSKGVFGRWSANEFPAGVVFYKSRGSVGSGTQGIVVTGDVIGSINAYADDGVDADTPSSAIILGTEGTIGAGAIPGIVRIQTALAGTLADVATFDSSKVTTFLGDALVSNATPRLIINDSNGTAENRRFDWIISSDNLSARLTNDADDSSTTYMSVQRTANTCDVIGFTATSLTTSGTLTVSGTILSVGSTPAGSGVIAVPANSDLRAKFGGGDITLIGSDGSGNVVVGDGGGGTDPTAVIIGTSSVDTYIAGELVFTKPSTDYLIGSQGSNLTIESVPAATDFGLSFFTADGDGTDDVNFSMFGVGTSAGVTNRERILIAYNVATTQFHIQTEANGTGTLRDLVLFTEGNTGQLLLGIDGNVSASGTFTALSYATVGGAGVADSNTFEPGPGQLYLNRDDTATVDQLVFGKNGAEHTAISTSTLGLLITATVGQVTIAQSKASALTAELSNSHATTPYGMQIDFTAGSPDDNTRYFLNGQDSTTNRFFIYSDGDGLNHDGTWGIISDERFKADITPASDQREDVKWLGTHGINYRRIEDGKNGRRFLSWGAQTVQAAGLGGLVMECGEDEDAFLGLRTSVAHTKATIALGQHLTEWDDEWVPMIGDHGARIETVEEKVVDIQEWRSETEDKLGDALEQIEALKKEIAEMRPAA